jgi:hypothetical protein
MPNYYPRRIQPADSLLYDAQGNLVGLRSGTSGDEAIFGLSASELAATQALVSKDGTGASIAAFGPTLFVAADSIIAQSLNPPNAGFLCTTTKGSHINSGGVNVQGVTNIYSETPLRLKFRASHGVVTGDEVMFWPAASGMAVTSLNLAYHRLRVTVTAADEVTLDGTVAADCPAGLTSASAAGDALFIVDMAYGNYGFLSWALHELGHPFSRIDYCFRPGARSDQLAVAVPAELTRTYTHGLLHVGRNDGATDYSTSLATLRDLLLAKCGLITVVLPFPDGNATLATARGMARISAFWYAQQATYPNIRVCDLWGAFSDPTLSNEASDAGWIGPDNVHPRAAGCAVGGAKLAPSLFEPINPIRRALARVGANGSNLLTGGRFTAAGGTAGAGVTGTVATSFTVGDRSNTNVTAYTQVCRTPALKRRHSTAYVAGEILDIGDAYWYVVKTAGTSAASLPGGYATATMYDSATGVTDGTAVVFRVPQFLDKRDPSYMDIVRWQYIDQSISSDTGNDYVNFFQSVALPGSVVEGDYIRAEAVLVVADGHLKYHTVRARCINGAAAQIACSHGLGPNGLPARAPALEMRPRLIQTPPLRVPSATATLEFRFAMGCGIEGARVFVALPLLEEVAAP